MPVNNSIYEAQTRLLAAVLATWSPKLDFNAIAAHMGSDVTKSGVDHRLRPIKRLAQAQKIAVARGEDPANLTVGLGGVGNDTKLDPATKQRTPLPTVPATPFNTPTKKRTFADMESESEYQGSDDDVFVKKVKQEESDDNVGDGETKKCSSGTRLRSGTKVKLTAQPRKAKKAKKAKTCMIGAEVENDEAIFAEA